LQPQQLAVREPRRNSQIWQESPVFGDTTRSNNPHRIKRIMVPQRKSLQRMALVNAIPYSKFFYFDLEIEIVFSLKSFRRQFSVYVPALMVTDTSSVQP
jgi:hypothetical protein